MPPAQVENLRRKIVAVLLVDANRPNNELVRALQCSHHSVARVRRELEETGTIGRVRFAGGRPGKDARPAPRPLAAKAVQPARQRQTGHGKKAPRRRLLR